MFGNSRQVAKMTLVNMLVREVSGYNPMYSRPYEAHVTGHDLNALGQRIAEHGTGQISGTLLAGLSRNIMNPSATHSGEIAIPNGWGERRLLFVLEVLCEFTIGSAITYYFQGYTTYSGLSYGDAVDPQMEFIINSFIGVTRTNQLTPFGFQTVETIVESSQALAEITSTPYQPHQHFMMRPVDVVNGMQAAYLQSGYEGMGGQGYTLDNRIVLKREAERANRASNIPTNFMAKVIDGYCVGRDLSNFGMGEGDILNRARDQLVEAKLSDNPFIRYISDNKAMGLTNRFTEPELQRLQPGFWASNLVQIIRQGTTLAAPSTIQPGATSYWHGATQNTVAATVLSNAVPALMMEMMINEIHFTATNYDITNQNAVNIIGAKSKVNADMTKYYELFKRRFAREIMYDLTYGNQVPYMVSISADVFGDTLIKIRFDQEPEEDFMTPSFCDNLLTPLIASTYDQYSNLVSTFDGIVNTVAEAMGSSTKATTQMSNLV